MLYDVVLKEEIEYNMEVEAEDSTEAIEKAWEILENDENGRESYFSDSMEGESIAYELDEW